MKWICAFCNKEDFEHENWCPCSDSEESIKSGYMDKEGKPHHLDNHLDSGQNNHSNDMKQFKTM